MAKSVPQRKSASPAAPAAADETFDLNLLGETVKVDEIKSVPRGRNTGDKYRPIRERIAKLKIGQAFHIKIPKTEKVEEFSRRIFAAIKNKNVTVPEGGELFKTRTVDGTIAIGIRAKATA